MKIVLATGNPDKVKEIREIMAGGAWELLTLADFPPLGEIVEDGDTLKENALIKARAVHAHTGLPALADDSGLEVDALGGRPGVHSARYAGENADYHQNNLRLMREMEGVPPEKRTARFRCVAALVDDSSEICADGICEGVIQPEYTPRKSFGYDPIFYVPEKGVTFADMDKDEKNAISHRGRAFKKMRHLLSQKS